MELLKLITMTMAFTAIGLSSAQGDDMDLGVANSDGIYVNHAHYNSNSPAPQLIPLGGMGGTAAVTYQHDPFAIAQERALQFFGHGAVTQYVDPNDAYLFHGTVAHPDGSVSYYSYDDTKPDGSKLIPIAPISTQ